MPHDAPAINNGQPSYFTVRLIPVTVRYVSSATLNSVESTCTKKKVMLNEFK